MFENVSVLNAISAVGLLVMIGLAFMMSSARRKINWRLVVIGVGLQLVLAAIFFNSQNWKFPRTFRSFAELRTAVVDQSFPDSNLPVEELLEGRFESFEQIRQATDEPKPAPEEKGTEDSKQTLDERQKSAQRKMLVLELDSEIRKGFTAPRFKNGIVFYAVESFFDVINRSVEQGTGFLFSAYATDEHLIPATHPRTLLFTFAFGVLPTVIFFAALMSVLYYIGLMQIVIRGMAWVMQKTLGVTGAESLAAAANVLVGHTEAPLVVKPYVASMTRSELNAMMVGGFATISGSLMAIFAARGVSAGHLLSASIISAPAALILAKILQPETETPQTLESVEAQMETNATNVLQAAANGASEGMKLAINIAAMLIAFLAMIMFVDIILQSVAGLFGLKLSLSIIFGAVFSPLAWAMGIETKDCMTAGNLLGEKMVLNEFVAYLSLIGDQAKPIDQQLSERSQIIMTYALCGFSNFGAIGIQLGGIGPLAPNRRGDLAQLGLRAMLGGMLACCMTACIAGLLYGVLI